MVRVSQIEEISQKMYFQGSPSKCNIDSQGEKEDASITGYTNPSLSHTHQWSDAKSEVLSMEMNAVQTVCPRAFWSAEAC